MFSGNSLSILLRLRIGFIWPESPRRALISENTSTSKRRHVIVLLAGTLLALAGIGWFLRTKGPQFHWAEFVSTVRGLDPYWMTAAVLLIGLTYVGRALRWQVLMRPVCPHAKFRGILVATTIGFATVVLFGRAGEMVRPYLIASREKVSFSSQLAAWLLERIYDLLVVLLISGFALTQLQGGDAGFSPALQWVLRMGGYIIAGICALCIILLLLVRNFSDSMQKRFLSSVSFLPKHYYEKLEEVVRAFAAGMESTKSHNFVMLLVLYTAAEWIIITGSQVCMFKAAAATAHLGWTDALTFVGFVAFGSIVQIPGVGGGMQVASVLVLTEFFGLPFGTATGLAIAFWITTYVTALPPGLWLAFREGIKISSLRHIEA